MAPVRLDGGTLTPKGVALIARDGAPAAARSRGAGPQRPRPRGDRNAARPRRGAVRRDDRGRGIARLPGPEEPSRAVLDAAAAQPRVRRRRPAARDAWSGRRWRRALTRSAPAAPGSRRSCWTDWWTRSMQGCRRSRVSSAHSARATSRTSPTSAWRCSARARCGAASSSSTHVRRSPRRGSSRPGSAPATASH